MSVISRYQSNPGEEHWSAMKNILKYLRRTKDLFLFFGGDSELNVEGYSVHRECTEEVQHGELQKRFSIS